MDKRYLDFNSECFEEYVVKYRLKTMYSVVAYCITTYGQLTPKMWILIKDLLDRGVITEC